MLVCRRLVAARPGARELRTRLATLKAEVQPKGILGAGPRDRDLWATYQATIAALFQNQEPEAALALANELHRRRIDPGLTPAPDYNLQELIIGFLLQTDGRRARSTVRLWLENSRMPLGTLSVV